MSQCWASYPIDNDRRFCVAGRYGTIVQADTCDACVRLQPPPTEEEVASSSAARVRLGLTVRTQQTGRSCGCGR